MMRIRNIPTSVTLLMLAIILAAPIVTNALLAMSHTHQNAAASTPTPHLDQHQPHALPLEG